MKRRLISILLIVCMLVSILPVEAVFATEPDHENAELQTSEQELLPEPAAQPDERENPETGSDLAQEQGKSLKTTVEETASEDPTEPTEPTDPTDPSEPEDPPITRAQWIQMLVQTFSMTVEDNNLPDNYFSDLTGAELYYRDILVAVEFGVIDIAAGGAFEPEGIVTREFAAQTLNYCLGFQLEANPEYTFQEADTVAHPEDLQVGINRGWFSLTDGKVSPALEVTTSEMVLMQADAEAVLAAQNDVGFEENSVTISEGVKEIPLGTVVGTDANGNLTVENCPVKISAGDFFVAYYGELPVAMKALSVSQEDKITVIAFTTDGTEDILSDMQFNGTINVDLRDFVPDSETRTRVVSGQVLTEGPAKRAIKFDEDSMSLEVTKDIKLTNGLKININYELENIDLDYSVDQKTNTSKLVFRGDNDITISVKGDSVPALNDGEEWELGYFPILFGLARIEVVAEFGVSGEISVCIGGRMGIGYTYNKTDGFRIIKEFQKDKFDCTAQVSAKIGVKAKIGFDYLVTRADLYASLGVNGTVKDTRHLDSDTVKDCQDISLYLYAKGGVEAHIFLLPSWKFEGDLWDADTSPLRLHYHMEDGILVDACTMDSSDSDYYTNSSSKYFNPGFNSGSSTYTGSNGETVTLWSYTVNSNGEATITKYNGSAATLTIPAYIDGYPVVAFGSGSNAFANKTSVRSVYISKGITTIGSSAFSGCTNLYSVSIPNSISSIGGSAFQSCTGLTNIEIPGSGVFIGENAFSYCSSLEAVSIPDSTVFSVYNSDQKRGSFHNDSIVLYITKDTGVIPAYFLYAGHSSVNNRYAQDGIKKIVVSEGITEIGDYAFALSDFKYLSECTIQEIILPSTVVKIGDCAFRYNQMTSITMPTGNPEITTEIGKRAFFGCNNLKSISIPEGVVTLNDFTICACSSLESVSLPSTLVTIGYQAFAGCTSLVDCKLPRGTATLGVGAFYNCKSLPAIEFTADMATINTECFYGCSSLTDIYIPTNITGISQNAFAQCTSLQTVSVADSTSFTGYYAREDTDYSTFTGDHVTLNVRSVNGSVPEKWLLNRTAGIERIVLEEGIASIGTKAFYSTESAKTLRSVALPVSLIDLGSYAFYDCAGLEEINLSPMLTAIKDYTFYGCAALKSIDIHNRIMKLGSYVFYGAGLETVVVPSSVTEMGTYDFAKCINLTSVSLPAARRKVEVGTFYNCSALTSITLPRLVDTIGAFAFMGCTSLTEINWSERITTIGNSSFRGCAALQTIDVPETVTSIGTYAFADCTSLTEIALPENTATLANYLFSGCTALQTYTLPANVTTVGDGVFSECAALNDITLPEGLQTLGQKVFYNCDALQNIAIPAGTKSFGAQCFYDCDALSSLDLPNSVTSIGTHFCYSADNLVSVTLSEGMTAIPEAAFMDCAKLDNVVVPRRVTSIAANAFNVCPSLLRIVLPASVTTMAGNALSYPDRTVIYGRSGSYAETYADKYGYAFVEYEVNATGVTLSESAISIPRGKTATLVATVSPADYTDDVTWKSTNTGVVTVSDNGVVTAVGVGTATVRMVVGNVSASCKITVIEPVTKVTLSKTTLTLDARETAALSATVTPTAATIKTVRWSSSNEAVATVDENGVVTAVGKGTAKITATAEDGTGIFASCTVTVTGNYIIAESIDELQSPHPYENGSKDYWSYTVDGAEKLYVSFSELTTVEEESDYIDIYDGSGNLIGTYTGEALAGQTIEVPGNAVVIKLVSDNSYSEYGFSVTAVEMEEPPHVHNFGEWTLTHEPSCTENGIETRICAACGENETREVAALGHDYVETVIAPSCVDQGYSLYTCSRCAESYKDTYTDPLGHNFEQGICSRCGVADPAYENASLIVSGGHITALHGETVTVPVMITGGAGFAGFTMTITTTDGITLKNIEKGELLNNADGSLTKNLAQGKVNWTDTVETAGNGEILLLTIEVSETAGTEETITIRLKDNKSTNMVDSNGKAITTRFEDIVISTQTVLYGDTNSDGEIDTADAVRLVRYLVDLTDLTELQKQAADVNHDGDITSADAIKLVRYLVGLVDTLDSLQTKRAWRAIQAGEIIVASVDGQAGDTVLVPVLISDNPGFAGFTMELSYPDCLQLVSVTKGNVLQSSDSGALTVNLSKNIVNWNDITDLADDGELLILTFKISDDVTDGQYTISIAPKDDKVGNFATEDGCSIAAAYTSGEVQVGLIKPFVPCVSSGHCPGISFTDMPAVENWAHDAIDWAITTGVTVGTSGTTFSPDKACTRAEVVTFLWREAGSPEPTTNSCGFTDVKDGSYYEKAVIWAAEKGIAKGTSESTFSPDKACTRAEVVTFLWRANGSPEVNNTCKFTDVEPGAYYERAVIWAAQEGITVGTAATIFGVGGACTRAQIVTFLYRNQEMQ